MIGLSCTTIRKATPPRAALGARRHGCTFGIERNGLPASAVSIMPDLSRTVPNPSGVYRPQSPLKPNRFDSDAGPGGVSPRRAAMRRGVAVAAGSDATARRPSPRSTARLARPSTAAPSRHRSGATPPLRIFTPAASAARPERIRQGGRLAGCRETWASPFQNLGSKCSMLDKRSARVYSSKPTFAPSSR